MIFETYINILLSSVDSIVELLFNNVDYSLSPMDKKIYYFLLHTWKIGSQIWPPKRVNYTPNSKVVNILPIKGSLYQELPFKGSKYFNLQRVIFWYNDPFIGKNIDYSFSWWIVDYLYLFLNVYSLLLYWYHCFIFRS